MGEPARNLPIAWDDGTNDDESEGPLLQRWIDHPDGRVEFVERDEDSFSLTKEGVRPALILEIVSPSKRSIREVDEVAKVEVYSLAGIPEYLLVDLPRRGNGYQLGLKGYHLGADGRYRPIEADSQGHLLCKATRLRFFIPPGGKRVEVIDDVTGLPLFYSEEEEAQRKATKAALETARAENARLRAEIERLRRQTRQES